MGNLRAGRLKDLVDIQEATETSGASGGNVKVWTTVEFDVPCDIVFKRSQEGYQAQGQQEINSFEVRFRYEPGLLNTNRRLIEKEVSPNRILEIVGVVDPENSRYEEVAQCAEYRYPRRE